MAYVKKISDEQFTLDCVNKELEIANTGLHFGTFEALVGYAKEHQHWYSDFEFKTPEEYQQWKNYFFEHFYDWKPKSYSKATIEREFRWFDLDYGLKWGYDYLKLEGND